MGGRPVLFDGADRAPNAELMQAGILTRITYPTGGHTSFEFEPHDYGYLERAPVPTQVLTKTRTVSVQANKKVTQASQTIRISRKQVVHLQGHVNDGPNSD